MNSEVKKEEFKIFLCLGYKTEFIFSFTPTIRMNKTVALKCACIQWLTIENQNDPIYEVNDQFSTSWFEY